MIDDPRPRQEKWIFFQLNVCYLFISFENKHSLKWCIQLKWLEIIIDESLLAISASALHFKVILSSSTEREDKDYIRCQINNDILQLMNYSKDVSKVVMLQKCLANCRLLTTTTQGRNKKNQNENNECLSVHSKTSFSDVK